MQLSQNPQRYLRKCNTRIQQEPPTDGREGLERFTQNAKDHEKVPNVFLPSANRLLFMGEKCF
jgi:hypothetical protein